MVALSSWTVAPGSASMVAWAGWMLIILFGLVHAHASPSGRYGGEVSGEEVVIDQMKDYLRTHHLHGLRQLAPSPPHTRQQNVEDKIEFAVTPQDPRYYLPLAPPHRNTPSDADLLGLLSPDLNLQPNQEYPGDLLQYQDEDARYPPEYPVPYSPQYRQEERYPHSYLGPQEIQYPRAGRLYPGGLHDTRLLEDDTDGVFKDNDDEEEAEEDGREESKRLMEDVGSNEEDQLMMRRVANEEEQQTKKAQTGSTEGHIARDEGHTAATSQPEAVNYMHLRREPANAKEAKFNLHSPGHPPQDSVINDLSFTALVAGCTAVAVCGVIGAGICWYRLNKSHRAAQDAEYPAYGVTGPNKDLSPSSGDRKLAQSAHMYHYQHQKQQMIALEKSSGGERHGSTSDVDSEEEGEENEYTVYECPGLAPTGEMEVKNPLFHDDPTPATPSLRKDADEHHQDHEEEINNK